jgi:DNA-binding PadR family transcriptional regulator
MSSQITSGPDNINVEMAKARKVTELEGCVLAVIGTKGPCTPYAVRREFLQSPTPFWSGSAGAIYPLVSRLADQGLIDGTPQRTDSRRSKHYSLTAAGEEVLENWLDQPAASIVIGTPPDPLRNRIEFLVFLPPQTRKRFLNEVRHELEMQIEALAADIEEYDRSNHFEYLAIRGLAFAAKARLDWIVEVTGLLDSAIHIRPPQRDGKVRHDP